MILMRSRQLTTTEAKILKMKERRRLSTVCAVRFAQTAFLHVIAMTYISTCPTGHVAMQHLRSPTDRFRVNASKVEVSWAGPTFGRDSTCTVLHNATHVT
uniref:Fibronectin type-III domain-containing protein n=2 Tax=Mesocestoides corti TaxID=53468 RepID=A0A5K3FWR7_MESCO